MKKLLFTLLTLVSFTTFGQYMEGENSFSKTYQTVRGWKAVEGEWMYDDRALKDWQFIFNVDFFASPSGREMYGAVMIDDQGAPQYFFNYLGDIHESEDEYGEYGAYRVDVLAKDDETGKWDLWTQGNLKYYGYSTMFYMGSPPYNYYFSYFEPKE